MKQKRNRNETFSFQKRLQSFSFAWSGIRTLFREEHNARIHLVAAFLVIFAGFFFEINALEWLFLILSISLVFAAEAFNSALESLCDVVSPETNENIRKTKDLAAGAVLMLALFAIFVGGIIFFPKIFALFASGGFF